MVCSIEKSRTFVAAFRKRINNVFSIQYYFNQKT